jgi:hypothetical protein
MSLVSLLLSFSIIVFFFAPSCATTNQRTSEYWRSIGGCSAGLSRLVLAYFLSQNTIHSTSRALFILPAEHPLGLQRNFYFLFYFL